MIWFRRCLAALALGLLAACQQLPETGRDRLLLLSEDEEVALGESAWREVLAGQKASADAAATAMLRRVGSRVAAATGRSYAWEFVLVESDQVNAFALPGGKVAVHTGILAVTRDEAGLAAVIGHEVAHVVARHGGERLSQGLLAQVALASVALAMERGDRGTVETVTGLLGAGIALGVLLPYSRTHEYEADRLGLTYMAKAGYDPRAAVALWRRMAERPGAGARLEYLSTHPSDANRIAAMERWLPEALAHYPGGAAPPAAAAPAIPAPAPRPVPVTAPADEPDPITGRRRLPPSLERTREPAAPGNWVPIR